MELASQSLRMLSQALALVAEAVGALIVGVAMVQATWRYLSDWFARTKPFPAERIRLNVGRSLALALEFLLAADILRTAVEPTWDEIARLAAIAAIRTGLNFFLQREIVREEARTGAPVEPRPPDRFARSVARAQPPEKPRADH